MKPGDIFKAHDFHHNKIIYILGNRWKNYFMNIIWIIILIYAILIAKLHSNAEQGETVGIEFIIFKN